MLTVHNFHRWRTMRILDKSVVSLRFHYIQLYLIVYYYPFRLRRRRLSRFWQSWHRFLAVAWTNNSEIIYWHVRSFPLKLSLCIKIASHYHSLVFFRISHIMIINSIFETFARQVFIFGRGHLYFVHSIEFIHFHGFQLKTFANIPYRALPPRTTDLRLSCSFWFIHGIYTVIWCRFFSGGRAVNVQKLCELSFYFSLWG